MLGAKMDPPASLQSLGAGGHRPQHEGHPEGSGFWMLIPWSRIVISRIPMVRIPAPPQSESSRKFDCDCPKFCRNAGNQLASQDTRGRDTRVDLPSRRPATKSHLQPILKTWRVEIMPALLNISGWIGPVRSHHFCPSSSSFRICSVEFLGIVSIPWTSAASID